MDAPERACSDQIDNDGDGAIDYPDDPGCRDPNGWTEEPACDDGFDNDGDGAIDLADLGCSDSWRQDESVCGLGFEIVGFLLPLFWFGRLRHGRGRKVARRRP